MILAIGTPATSNPFFVPSTAPCGDTLSCAPGSTGVSCSREADELSLAQPGPLTAGDETYQRASLKILARSKMTVLDDGDVRFASRTKLRFHYDFEAADGTSIQIRAQANLSYSQTTDSEDGWQSSKLRATARVSILQANVSSGVAPLLQAPDISPDAKEIVSQALDLFQQVIGATASAFLDSDPLDGDSLIAGLVEAFNGLAAAIGSMSLSRPTDPATLPQPTVDPSAVPAAEPAPTIVSLPVGTEPATAWQVPPQGEVPSDPLSAEPVETAVQEETPVVTNDVLLPSDLPEAAHADQQVAPATSRQSVTRVESVMMRVRLQMMQSLSSVVEAFDPEPSSLHVSRSMFRASTQLSTLYSISGTADNGSLSHANRIDTHV